MKLEVQVHTNSKRPRVLIQTSGLFHVYVNQPPVDNKANQAACDTLAAYFNISRSKVSLLSGVKSKRKLFEIKN